MSTLKATNLSHASAASPNIVLDSAGKTTFGGAVAGAGMDLITPTSVAGTGVTLSGGQVTFTTATSISVNGCFTATYDNYIIHYVISTGTSLSSTGLRLRSAGTDNSSSNYGYQAYKGVFATPSFANYSNSAGTTSFFTGENSASQSSYGCVNVGTPALTVKTTMLAQGVGDLSVFGIGGQMTVTTAYDGFTIFVSAGTYTGTLRVYGLRNS